MATASETGKPETSQAIAVESEQRPTLTRKVLEVARGIFWSTFGIVGHLLIALVGLLVAVAIILSPILVLGAVIQFIAWLLP